MKSIGSNKIAKAKNSEGKVRPTMESDSLKDAKSQLQGFSSQNHLEVESSNDPSLSIMQGNSEAMQYLAELNEEAVQLINADSFEEALSSLNQAEEKISTLEHIDPNEETYIITVFYNIAC